MRGLGGLAIGVSLAIFNLVRDLLAIGAKKMLDALGVLRPGMERALERLKDIPTDIEPVR